MKDSPFVEIITGNQKMLEMFQQINSISASRQPVLITGETGVGKELFAKAIHKSSHVKGLFVPINAAGLDENTFSDTLFGHVRGAFTGAEKERKGQCAKADNGTLFLDEIGDLSLSVQVKLLRLLQEGEYQPLGSDKTQKTNARILAATNADLWELQREGGFRNDLNYRLRTHHFNIPPLRERLDDIPLLVNHFLDEASLEFKKRPYATEDIFNLLKQYSFPGNIRELRSMVYNAVGNYQSGALSLDVFQSYINRQQQNEICFTELAIDANSPFSSFQTLPTIKQATEYLVIEAMKRANGNQTVAAKMLGISQPALSNRLKKMSVEK
ncbi:Two component, sigma-54 specific, transcriptional regulator, Fis family (fragment) [Desulfamplus magnetovallimortis]|uniref:Two component, sigma-54 specific, transcriptional regulator, Fis family n=2 Tax=Desulfamplus magnetovallimortis TaxID=1246637 RepID=A0A1W1HEY9_9BACT